MGGAYVRVREEIMDYGNLAEYLTACVNDVRERLFDAMGLSWQKLWRLETKKAS